MADSRVLNLAFENQKNGSSSRDILQGNLRNGCTVQTSLQSIHLQNIQPKISSLKNIQVPSNFYKTKISSPTKISRSPAQTGGEPTATKTPP